MQTEQRIVDNRIFLLGLDDLYREAMKRHERDELLRSARETAQKLAVPPADVPIEGYYHEDERLTEYFRLMRAMQQVESSREREVAGLAGFQRLKVLVNSGLFGTPDNTRYLLPAGCDPLSEALDETAPNWSIESLVQVAYESAAASNDFSLVALAVLARDPVVLAALRETAVLYAAVMAAGCYMPREPEFVWRVDDAIQQRAAKFVATFNNLFNESLPTPVPEHASVFWEACDESKIVGRCVRIGVDDPMLPTRHYHWTINVGPNGKAQVNDFWDAELWTTERYREKYFGMN